MGFGKHAQLSEVVEVEKKRESRWIDIINTHIAAVSVFAFNIKASNNIRCVFLSLDAREILCEVQFQHIIMPVQAVDIDRSRLSVIHRVR